VGNAAQRNRAKRLSREAFRCVRGQLPAGLDLLVIVRQGLGSRTLPDVVAEWLSCRARIERRFAEVPVSPPEARGRAALAAKNSC
jgi:ribonuclease P protein component